MTEAASARRRLIELLRSFGAAILVTHTREGGLHARPLAVAEVRDDDTIVFSTAIDSAKVAEITSDPRVLVVFQDAAKSAVVAGTARVLTDRSLVEKLWSESWRLFFPAGKDDPDLCLIEVTAAQAEYWDNSGLKGLKYLFNGARAYMRGERVDTDDVHAHAKVTIDPPR